MLKFDKVQILCKLIIVVEILLRGTVVCSLIFLKLLKLSAISSVTYFKKIFELQVFHSDILCIFKAN